MEEIVQHYLESLDPHLLEKSTARLIEQYKKGEWHLDADLADAYLAVRFPATKAVLGRVMEEAPSGETLLDFGAGPATAAFATEIPKITHVEHNPHFVKLGQKLKTRGAYTSTIPDKAHDLVLCSYSLGEGSQDLQKLWSLAKKTVIIIEPGTPQGYQNMLKARSFLIENGGFVKAPCPHNKPCPMEKGWCHFGQKVQRTQIHRLAKLGTLGYEEEKYSYVIVTKQQEPTFERILHVPKKRKGLIQLTLCTKEGIIEKKVTRKDPQFKAIKKLRWGDSVTPDEQP